MSAAIKPPDSPDLYPPINLPRKLAGSDPATPRTMATNNHDELRNRTCNQSDEENLSFYDESGNPTDTAVKALLYVNRGREANKNITSTSAPMVAITKAKS